MRGEIDFGPNERDFREIHPNPPIGESLDFGSSPIDNAPKTETHFENFDVVAKNFSRVEKIIDRKEMSESSILFQQNIIKEILSAENPDAVKKVWAEYQDLVNGYAKELASDRDKAEARAYFSSLKRSVLGSVATIDFFEKQGFIVKFPTVKEDGWKKCDLIFEPNKNSGKKFGLAVQVKSRHLPAMSRKEVSEVADRLVLANDEKLNGDDLKDFKTLNKYCDILSKEAGKSVFTLFVNMPVSREMRNGGILQLVDQSGKMDVNMKKTLEAKWEKCVKEMARVDKK